MLQFLGSWLFAALALLLSDRLFDGVTLRGDLAAALWVAAGYSILSFLVGWLVFGLLGVATLGLGFLFHFVTELVTAALIVLLTSALSSRFEVKGFLPALGTAILLALGREAVYRVFEAI